MRHIKHNKIALQWGFKRLHELTCLAKVNHIYYPAGFNINNPIYLKIDLVRDRIKSKTREE